MHLGSSRYKHEPRSKGPDMYSGSSRYEHRPRPGGPGMISGSSSGTRGSRSGTKRASEDDGWGDPVKLVLVRCLVVQATTAMVRESLNGSVVLKGGGTAVYDVFVNDPGNRKQEEIKKVPAMDPEKDQYFGIRDCVFDEINLKVTVSLKSKVSLRTLIHEHKIIRVKL